jgi:hypothetical protein
MHIWYNLDASSANTIHLPIKKLIKRRIGMCLGSTLKNFKPSLKIKGRVEHFLISGIICPNQGLLIDITAQHL